MHIIFIPVFENGYENYMKMIWKLYENRYVIEICNKCKNI